MTGKSLETGEAKIAYDRYKLLFGLIYLWLRDGGHDPDPDTADYVQKHLKALCEPSIVFSRKDLCDFIETHFGERLRELERISSDTGGYDLSTLSFCKPNPTNVRLTKFTAQSVEISWLKLIVLGIAAGMAGGLLLVILIVVVMQLLGNYWGV